MDRVPNRVEAGKQVFCLGKVLHGNPIETRSGRSLRVVAFQPGVYQGLVILDIEDNCLELYSQEGVYQPPILSGMDIIMKESM